MASHLWLLVNLLSCLSDRYSGEKTLRFTILVIHIFSQRLRECVIDVSNRAMNGHQGMQSKCHKNLFAHLYQLRDGTRSSELQLLSPRSMEDFWKGHLRHLCFSHQCFTTQGLTVYQASHLTLYNLLLLVRVSFSFIIVSPSLCQTDTQRSLNVRAVCHKWIIDDDMLKSHIQRHKTMCLSNNMQNGEGNVIEGEYVTRWGEVMFAHLLAP